LTGGVIGSRVRAAVAERQQLGFEVETARRAALANAQNAWNQAVAGGEQMAAGQRATEAAESALTGVQRGFAEGFRSNFEVLDSEQRLLTAQLVFVNATYGAYAAEARLLATLRRSIRRCRPMIRRRIRGWCGPRHSGRSIRCSRRSTVRRSPPAPPRRHP
jgi:outer membrane protein